MITPRVVDIYHGDNVEGNDCVIGFQKAKDAGIWGVIHKSSQGTSITDSAYARRRRAAEQVGLLWGAYHFNTGENITDQVNHFISVAQPTDKTLMVLDFEDNPRRNMTPQQAVDFLRTLEDRLGRKGAIYSGNRIKETVDSLTESDQAYLTSHRLWLCQYGPRAVLPHHWSEYFLWQYTGDGIGLPPHWVDGISVPGGKGIDLNVYNGTQEELTANWT